MLLIISCEYQVSLMSFKQKYAFLALCKEKGFQSCDKHIAHLNHLYTNFVKIYKSFFYCNLLSQQGTFKSYNRYILLSD